MPLRPMLRRCGATLAAGALLVASAAAQVAPPLEGVTERAAGFLAVPRARPTIGETFASGCTLPHPELAFAALPRDLRDAPMASMIGQLLVVSYSGTKPGDAGVRAAAKALAQSRIGGVLTFRHNVSSARDIRAVNAAFSAADERLPPIIAVDQEGGLVMRVKSSEGAPQTPAAADVAATSAETAKTLYAEMAANLADLGFNANFGPVVDLAVNPDNPVIARFGRSYGATPSEVTPFATAFVEAHRENRVGTALKHFPGHGSSTDDSHEGTIDLAPTWHRAELAPYRDMIAAGEADMVMVGHLRLAELTGDAGLPASLSPDAIDGFLRETLCYDGIVVSDDFAMDAVSARWSTAEAVQLMIEAGGDLALLSLPAGQGFEVVDDIIARLVDRAAISRDFADRIRHAYARIVNYKLDLAAMPDRAGAGTRASATGR